MFNWQYNWSSAEVDSWGREWNDKWEEQYQKSKAKVEINIHDGETKINFPSISHEWKPEWDLTDSYFMTPQSDV